MAAGQYSAGIDHTEKTITALFRAEYHAYEKSRMLLRLLLGLALIFAAALLTLPAWVKAILLLFGAWFAASMDFPSQIRADKTIEARKGRLPSMRYEFLGDRVSLTGEGHMTIPYKKFTRLTQDREYLYLFLDRDSVCMLDRKTLKPQEPEAFLKFIEEKTGLHWQREFSFLSLNLPDLLIIFRERRKSK